MLTRTVCKYNRALEAGFHIEDQQFPKWFLPLSEKSLFPVYDFI